LSYLLPEVVRRWWYDPGVTRRAKLRARFATIGSELTITESSYLKEILREENHHGYPRSAVNPQLIPDARI
jgi:hypothetical protein